MTYKKTICELKELMRNNYRAENLKNISVGDFEKHIRSKIGTVNHEEEGYSENELERQRGLSIKYHWGHNHDFGTFSLDGMMGDRHLELMADFCTLFSIDTGYFNGKSVFDIGSWTGGTALILAAISKNVFTIEEVSKYADTTQYLKESFDMMNLDVRNCSLYECNIDELYEKFNIIYFPGVIYHLSDPLLALRILYNSCKLDGIILVESAGIASDEPVCQYEGSLVFRGDKDEYSRSGWNWFVPSESALERMMIAAGFDEIETVFVPETNRVFAHGKKTKRIGITKAGLSIKNIR